MDLPQSVDRILCFRETQKIFTKSDYFCEGSDVTVLEVRDSKSTAHSLTSDESIKEYFADICDSKKSEVQCRIIFVSAVDGASDKIRITASNFKEICDTLAVSPRFIGSLDRQLMAGSSMCHDPETGKELRHELWYSLITRTRKVVSKKLDTIISHESTGYSSDMTSDKSVVDRLASKTVIDWSRVIVWAGHNLITGHIDAVILRCPNYLKQAFIDDFYQNAGSIILRNPITIHAYICDDFLLRIQDFLSEFSVPMYDLENGPTKAALDVTIRSQRFLTLSREIAQVATDYKIFQDAIRVLKAEHARLKSHYSRALPLVQNSDQPPQGYCFNDDVFDYYASQLELLHTYSNLYLTRAKLGTSEGFALATQREAEINARMAAESAFIAKATYQDSAALKNIQYLTMAFLPISLAASIFGMSFFSTDPGPRGTVVLNVSTQWWYFPLGSLILLVVTYGTVFLLRYYPRQRSLIDDLEVPEPSVLLPQETKLSA